MFPDALLYGLPVTEVFAVRAGQYSFQYSLEPEDDLGAVLYWRGIEHYDAAACRFFARLAPTWRQLIDVGANTGFYTLLALAVNPGLDVLSFEPVPRLHRRLLENLRINGFGHRCQARMEAVSDVSGVADLHIPDGGSLMASLNSEGHRGFSGSKIMTKVTTLDETWTSGGPVDFIKIDTEGFEDRVLAGMSAMLAKHKPTLMIECLPDGPISEVQRILRGNGYRFIQVSRRELHPRQEIIPDATRMHPDYLAVPSTVDPEQFCRELQS